MKMELFKLAAPLGRYGDSNTYDLHELKIVLNRLGYYMPPPYEGIEETREPALFDALAAFQRDKNIPVTEYLRPYDKTVFALRNAMLSRDNAGRYIWRTPHDSRVRDEHAARDGQSFTWGQPPEGGHPGENYNCRCWAELIIEKI